MSLHRSYPDSLGDVNARGLNTSKYFKFVNHTFLYHILDVDKQAPP